MTKLSLYLAKVIREGKKWFGISAFFFFFFLTSQKHRINISSSEYKLEQSRWQTCIPTAAVLRQLYMPRTFRVSLSLSHCITRLWVGKGFGSHLPHTDYYWDCQSCDSNLSWTQCSTAIFLLTLCSLHQMLPFYPCTNIQTNSWGNFRIFL